MWDKQGKRKRKERKSLGPSQENWDENTVNGIELFARRKHEFHPDGW